MKLTVLFFWVVCAFGAADSFAAGSNSPVEQTDPPAPQSTAPSSAATPPADSASAPAASPNAQAPDTSGAKQSAAKQPTKVILVDNNINDEQLKQILAKGYRPEGHGDKVLYCRKEMATGSHFSTKTCRTSTRILEDELQGKEVTTNAQRDNGSQTGH